MIVDASLVIDAVADSGSRGHVARYAIGALPADEPLVAPGHFAVEVLSGLRAAANRPLHPLMPEAVMTALRDADALEIEVEATPWIDVRRAWALSGGSLRFADAVYVAAAERHDTALITADARIERSGAPILCRIVTVVPADQ